MKFLFIHQNFPGQYRHLAPALAARGHQVIGMGETHNVKRQMQLSKGITLLGYRMPERPAADPFFKSFQDHVIRGRAVATAAAQVRAKGFVPDMIGVHIGWGEGLFLRDVFPESRILLFCEYFYQPSGGDYGFDPEIKPGPGSVERLRILNAPLLMAMNVCDEGITATEWQRSRYPAEFRPRVKVIHDGIDTDRVRPDPEARFRIPNTDFVLTRENKVVTYTTRNFEPYRGFHVFMRAVPEILKTDPQAKVVLVGGDDVSYSPRLPEGTTYRKIALNELGHQIDMSRVHFLPQLPYDEYVKLLQISSAHVYLTYPFVLSWSLLEAMSAGCAVVGSRTAPVTEVVRHGENGLLVDFGDHRAIAKQVCQLLRSPADYGDMRLNARRDVVTKYDLNRVCLPQHVSHAEALAAEGMRREGAMR